ncbi:MAG: methyltransferase domain-containing protein [Clostridiales bacterium]|nr:methyltransferase domain-containing protein [Clostridiales bacterium]
MKNEWNAKDYTDNFDFVYKYGEGVMDLLTVPKGAFVVDLGCGNGALTEKLFQKGYSVLGIDSSCEMLEKAAQLHKELKFINADAVDFKLENKADAIFSNAVFHWIENHDKLIKNLALNIKKGGELVFEFGGKGCAQAVHKALEKAFENHSLKYRFDFNFKSIGELAPLLEKNGFCVNYAILYNRPTEQKGENGLKNWINMFITSAFLEIDENIKNSIIDEAVEICRPKLYKNGKWFVDYVRICMRAVRI